MESTRKKPSTKKDNSRTDSSSFGKYASTSFARPPATGTSSSSSEDRSTSVKSSDNSPEDIIEIVPSPNNRTNEMTYPATAFKISRNNTKEGLDLKFDSAPSAYFTATKNDLPTDVTLSPQDGNRIPSPASISSLTSRPLEWDSGADVGYIAPGIETGLSTIERIALAQGSAILLPRSDPEGTTETSAKPIKIINPAIEKLVGTPAAESTVIKDVSSPLPGPKLFCPEGISPIVATNLKSKNTTPVETEDQVKILEPCFENLRLEEKNPQDSSKSEVPGVRTDTCDFDGGDVDKIKNQIIERDKGDFEVEPVDRVGGKEESKSAECLLEIGSENPPEHPLVLKKSASCSNLLQASRPVELKPLKPLKRHFQNSASSSSISTVIDRSKKKSRKLFATSSISEKTERSKFFKSPRKILSPSKKLHPSSSSRAPSVARSRSHESADQKKSENSQIAFHTSIQQSILDELQQCVNEISNNFNNQKCHNKAGSSSSSRKKKGSGSTRGNCSTLESVASVQTNDSWAADFNAKDSLTSAEKAKSFEYLPGDVYERNSSECFQAQKKMESSSSTSEKVDYSASSNEFWNLSSMSLFERDLERGVNLLKDFITNSTNFDSHKKQLLMKKIAKKLIEIDHESHRQSTSEHPGVSRKLGGETYTRDRITKQGKSELSGSTQSQSYIDSTSGSSCLNLVMRPLKKSTSVESSCPEKLSSGIRYIQENYRDNCTFESSNEVANNYLTSEISRQPLPKVVGRKGHDVSPDGPVSSVDWSKSSNSTGTQQRVFYGSEYRWLNEQSKRHPMSPKRKLSKFQDRKKIGLLGENSDDLPDGRTVNLGRSFKPFLNSDNSAKGSFDYRPFPARDWRKPTSDSERRYEEKLVCGNGDKKESALLFNYLDAERRNHLLWIQSEINHLSNLKALIEKQEKLKEGFKVLKSKKVDSKGDHARRKTCIKRFEVSSDVNTPKFSDDGSDKQHKAYGLSSDVSRSSSDKENKDLTNRTFVTNASASRPLPNMQRSKENKSQVLSDSHRVCSSSDVTNNTWATDSEKFHNASHKQSSSLSKQKKNTSIRKKTPKSISYTILFEPPKSMPPPMFQIPTPKIIKNVENSSTGKVPEPSLQECLARKHPEIIKRVEFRRNCIAELACLRQLQNERKKQLVLACGSVEKIALNPSVPELPSLKEKRIFSQKKLRQQTEKKYRKSFEVRQKLKEQKTKEDYRTNRLMAETFARKLQRKALKGQVDLSNSVMVIES